MSMAVIGLTSIQVYWLSYSVNLNQVKFDENVRGTLREVKRQVEAYDDQQHETYSGLLGTKKENSKHSITTDLLSSNLPDSLDTEKYRSALRDFSRVTNKMDIAQRINLDKLDEFLKNELESSSIPLSYDYAVYSEEMQDFVIVNGHFVKPIDQEVQASTIQTPTKQMDTNLRNSPYAIRLFNNRYDAPGALVLHFPNRTSHIWRDVLPMLLLTILFIGVISFAFLYSLNVIFRQKKLSEMKNDFINNMTHEFKTPIATISLATDSITSEKIVGNKDKVGRFAKIIKQENRRMLGQVEKVLQMAQIDQNKAQLNWDQVHVHALIELAKENVELIVQNRGGSITLDLQAQRDEIRSDQNHLSNVIHNLLDNANKYSPDTPVIKISTRNVGQGIEIAIQDHGQGMNKEARKHIFDKFYRVHTGDRHDVKGFGLGLSYVKAMVNAHQGSIRVKSELGKGSTFTIVLPFDNNEK